jgi:DNA-directed RNA polymerase specialized sigma24 family protein
VSDEAAPPPGLAEELATKPEVTERLMRLAFWHTRNEHDARDLAQEAIARALDSAANPPFDARVHSAYRFAGSILNGLAANWIRRRRRRVAADHEYDDADPSHAASRFPTPEEALLERERLRLREEMLSVVRTHLAKNAVALQVLDWSDQGVHEAGEQAAKIGCSVEAIYRAHRNISYHARQVKKRFEEEGEVIP